MFSGEQIAVFIGTAFLLTISPGPDIVATVSVGLSRGWRAALGFGMGCGTGCLLHTVFAVAGVSAAIRASPTAFQILKYSGAAWLAWLGIGALRSRGASVGKFEGPERSLWQYFSRGFLANAINPKVAIFFLSFLPGFVNRDAGLPELQMAILGMLFTVIAVCVFAVTGFFSGQIGGWLRARPVLSVFLDRMAGIVFLGLAIRLVWLE